MGSMFMNFDDFTGSVGKKRDRRSQESIAANDLAYKKQADKLTLEQKDRELALTRTNAQHDWEGQAATRDSTLAQLYKAQAIEARRAAMGHSFASALGRGSKGDSGGAATRRLMALLGNVNQYPETPYRQAP